MRQLLFVELNEINFEFVEYYCRRGSLPNFAHLMAKHGVSLTTSEEKYEHLEPWIQWVTAHTGKTFREHGIFRLGDIVNHDHLQIWEMLEARGLKVGAISPMNAKHRAVSPAFFVPDPWTITGVTASARLRGLYEAIAQAVNENAQSRLTAKSIMQLMVGLCSYASPAHYAKYAKLIATSVKGHWRKAILLDLLLADVFVSEVRRAEPHFATLFLNAGAHIQHHYLFSAACYEGPLKNPPWYLRASLDPVLEVYETYDAILGRLRRVFPSTRLMIATGLHQVPHKQVTYYWRLRNHAEFLKRIGAPFSRVETRMSRDFLVVCDSIAEAAAAESKLREVVTADGTPLFEVDNRERDLFVMLTYSRDISETLELRLGSERHELTTSDVAFVALKNGEHNGIGYFIDSGAQASSRENSFALAHIPQRIAAALGVI